MIIRLLKILILYSILIGPLLSNTNYFEEGLVFLKIKNTIKQNLNLNKILFLTQKTKCLTYIYRKFLKILTKKI